MSPRKPASEELTKEAIIEKARFSFIDKGFQKVSMRSVAKELGCSHGAIYYHFKNKAELFYAVVSDDFSKLNALVEKTAQSSEKKETKLFQLFLRFIEFGLNHQSQYEMMFMMRNLEVDGLAQEAANLSYQKFAQAVHSLALNKLAIVEVWSAFLALHGFVSYYRGFVSSFSEAEAAAIAHVKFIIKGLQ